MPSPPNSLPSPAVVCVQVFLPFVPQDIFTKAVISKPPSIKTKQAKTSIHQKPASRRSPAPAAHGEAAAAAQGTAGAALPQRGPRPPRPPAGSPRSSAVTHFTNRMITHGFASASARQYNLYAFTQKFIYKLNTCCFYFMAERQPQCRSPRASPTARSTPPGSSGKRLRRHLPFALGWEPPSLCCDTIASAAPHF